MVGKKQRCVAAVAALLTCGASNAGATVIAQWTFETSPPADLLNTATSFTFAADAGAGTASGTHASANTDWTTPAGNGSANAFSSNEWAVGDYYQYTVSTTGFSDLTLLLDHTSSGTGPTAFKLAYSTDGTTFTDVPGGAYAISSASGFSTATEVTTSPPRFGFDLSAINAIENQASVTFRVIATAIGTSTNGTSRMDNVVIGTDPVPTPEPGAVGLLAVAGAFGLRRGRRA